MVFQKKSELTKEEIRSHMTLLNNELISSLNSLCAKNHYAARLSLLLPDINTFRGSLESFYNEITPIFKQKERKKIEDTFDKYDRLEDQILKNRSFQNTANCKTVLLILTKNFRTMLTFLQGRRFLFRTETIQEVGGFEGAIKAMKDAEERGEAI